MCYPPGALPPDPPRDLVLAPMSGGAGGERSMLVSADGTRFLAYLARAGDGDAGVVILPDVRGLHTFYEQLADRFASADLHAVAFDYFGRTATTPGRGEDFDFGAHMPRTTPAGVLADFAAARAYLERQTGARRAFAVGFCFGGRNAFLRSADQPGLAGAIGFYGRLSRREAEAWPVPAEEAPRMRAPILGLFGGADPGIPPADVDAFAEALARAKVEHHIETYPGAPHSFFDRKFADYRRESDDAWRRAVGFIRSGDPARAA